MASDTDIASPRDPRRLFLIVFVVACVLLGAGYFAFLRGDYTVLYSQVKPAEAAQIVAALDAKGIAHKLRDGGATILVPSDEADSSQLAVAGSDVPLKGSVGFELFNKSDMGLTDFAQKINYQRALQGELARTIMMMDGIENARVHLALPERSLFRSRQSTPRAAVEVIARDGQTLGADRIAGIQQLVASAVPDLPLDEVVVLDGEGRVVSATQPADQAGSGTDTEQSAVQAYYSARAKTALAAALPGVEFTVHALVLATPSPTIAPPPAGDEAATPAPVAMPSTDPHSGARNFQLRMTVVTPTPLNPEDQQVARKAVADAIALDEAHGDSLAFEIGVAAPTPPVAPLPVSAPTNLPPATTIGVPQTPALGWWMLVAAAAIGMLAIAWLVARDRAPRLDAAERDAFVARLRRQLAGEDAHA